MAETRFQGRVAPSRSRTRLRRRRVRNHHDRQIVDSKSANFLETLLLRRLHTSTTRKGVGNCGDSLACAGTHSLTHSLARRASIWGGAWITTGIPVAPSLGRL